MNNNSTTGDKMTDETKFTITLYGASYAVFDLTPERVNDFETVAFGI